MQFLDIYWDKANPYENHKIDTKYKIIRHRRQSQRFINVNRTNLFSVLRLIIIIQITRIDFRSEIGFPPLFALFDWTISFNSRQKKNVHIKMNCCKLHQIDILNENLFSTRASCLTPNLPDELRNCSNFIMYILYITTRYFCEYKTKKWGKKRDKERKCKISFICKQFIEEKKK